MSNTGVLSSQPASTGAEKGTVSGDWTFFSPHSSSPYQDGSDSSGSVMSRETLIALTRFYGCVGIICFVFGITLNGLVFKYFYNRRKTLSNTLYCVIVITDIAVSVLILPYILPHFSENRAPLLFSSQGFCKFWTVLWGAFSKTTVVLVALLGILRTILLLYPLNNRIRSLKRRFVLSILLLYFLVLLFCETVPTWQDYHWYFDQLRMRCEWRDLNSIALCDGKCDRVRTFGYVWNTLTLAVPVLPMLVSAVLSVFGLRRGGRDEDKAKTYASVTIVLFTLLYVILNIPTLIFWIMMLRHWDSGYTSSLMKFDQPYYFYSNFVDVLTVALNSLLNPVLYLWRMRELRKYLSPTIRIWKGGPEYPTVSQPSNTNNITNTGSNIATKSSKLDPTSGVKFSSVSENRGAGSEAQDGSQDDGTQNVYS